MSEIFKLYLMMFMLQNMVFYIIHFNSVAYINLQVSVKLTMTVFMD
ncbi:hypothetical protein VCHA54P496_10516 [Vibrio chagasii]|nr:hypothetical protein VCHA34P129_140013 [Vibrio chagasii]CAH6952723.1 hypothetical protein VCHA52P455_130013 [Vibrio chagasii]CAH7090567.1 hypothetical protein VCHA54P495_10516 [Vibrio chagasii]CAH7093602.1 hypothetical protein VCHA54P496_10516 [Vibrio chagasii]CAH7472075.1 hypothetical protein VCHA54P486_50190 [Vibrio chagasii]